MSFLSIELSFVESFPFDGVNGSRWLSAHEDFVYWLVADLSKKAI